MYFLSIYFLLCLNVQFKFQVVAGRNIEQINLTYENFKKNLIQNFRQKNQR